MAKHTPGPWQVGPVDDTVVTALVNGERMEVAQIDGDYNQPDTWPIMEANARLIAAAPDLLEALSKIVESGVQLGGYHRALAIAAIARATGGQS